jgi:hypothetical protein
MKKFIAFGLLLSLSAWSASTTYAPNDGTANPGNPGTAHMDPTILNSADPTIEGQEENLERSNTSPNPISNDTTLQGTGVSKQSQEEVKEEVKEDVNKEVNPSTSPRVDHSDVKGEKIP